MPNIRRTAPGSSRPNLEDDEDEQQPVYRGGGKQFGKGFRPPPSDDDEDSDDEPAQQQQEYTVRGSGKQLGGGGGKYLRPTHDEDEEDDSEEEEQPQTVRIQPRSGGKNILRMSQPAPEEEDEEDSESEEDASPPTPQTYRVMGRGGGKSLSRMLPPEEESDDEDDDAEEPVQKIYAGHGGGKQIRHPEPEEEPPSTSVLRSTGGGKQLRRPDPEPAQAAIVPSPTARGKQLRRPEPEEVAAPSGISRSPAGGKQLRRPEPEEEEKATKKTTISHSPGGGKQLRRPEAEDEEPVKTTISSAPSGGKQLSRPTAKDSDEEMSFDNESDSDDEDFEETAQKPKGRPRRAAATKKKIVEESEDELFGEDDATSDEDEELDINNTEALIKDEKDRKYLDSLPELEREAILGERFEKLKEKQDLQKAIREAKRKEAEKTPAKDTKKRKAPTSKAKPKKLKTAGDEDLAKKLAGTRSSARERDVSGAKSKKAAALAALKQKRKLQLEYVEESSSEGSEMDFGDEDDDSDEEYEEKLKPWQKKKEKRPSTLSQLDDGSDMDIDDDEDVDDKTKKRRTSEMSDEPAAELDDFVKVTIPRRRLARWCNEPFFEAAVLECFVRLFIGEDDNGEKVYRLCEITEVKEDKKTYKFPLANKDDKPVSTSKVIGLKFGTSERTFPMYLVSDAIPNDIDVQKYVTTQRNNRLQLLTKRRAAKLRRVQDALVNNYTYTKEDIEKNLEQRKLQGKSIGKLGSEQTKVMISVQAAKETLTEATARLAAAKKALVEFTGDSREEAELEKQIENCEVAVVGAKKEVREREREEQALINTMRDRKKKLTGRSRDKNWAKVNQRALQINQQADRDGYKVQKEADARKAAGEKEKFNPYARRKVKPKILWEVGQAKDSDKSTDEKKGGLDGTDVDSPVLAEATTPTLVQENEKTAALGESHQFAIDEEGLAQSSTIFGVGVAKKTSIARVRKGLSLSEYLDRKGKGLL